MKTLLLFVLFDISNGGFKTVTQFTQLYASYDLCNEVGKSLSSSLEYNKPGLKSFSTCIPEDEFGGEL